jgi:uncharacterized protein
MTDMRFHHARIIVVCKAPIPGLAKSRLVPLLGEAGAARLHQELATRMIHVAAAAALAPVELWCAPDQAHDFFQGFASDRVQLFSQPEGDLGARMAHALASSLARPGVDRAVLIGTDCPTLDADYLNAAIAALGDHDAVIGPAEDGGYGLIGLRHCDEAWFGGIDWGGADVCARTCRHFNNAGLRFALLRLLWDVDRPEDVGRYQRSKFGTR